MFGYRRVLLSKIDEKTPGSIIGEMNRGQIKKNLSTDINRL